MKNEDTHKSILMEERFGIAKRVTGVIKALEILQPYEDRKIQAMIPMEKDGKKMGTAAGVFNDLKKVKEAVAPYNENNNVYITLQHIRDSVKTTNKLQDPCTKAIKDEDIDFYQWLFIDLDVIELLHGSDKGLEAAEQLAVEIVEFCTEHEWPLPLIGMSGNGYHIYYHIDLENSKENHDLVKNVLYALDRQFSTEKVTIDKAVHNPARLTKIFGLYSRKGDGSEERPHRKTYLMKPEGFEYNSVSQEQLTALVAELKNCTVKNGKGGAKPSQPSTEDSLSYVQIIMQIFEQEADWFLDKRGAVYCAYNDSLYAVADTAFKNLCFQLYYGLSLNMPANTSIDALRNFGEMKAGEADSVREVYLRIGKHNDALVYNLCNKARTAMSISPDAVSEIALPTSFLIAKSLQPQEKPNLPGDIMKILGYINVTDENQKMLLLVYLVTALIPDIAFPALLLHGTQGAAKTTAARMLKTLISPSNAMERSMPKKAQDLVVALSGDYLVIYDNVTKISQEQSDLLCISVTGGTVAARKLYTNYEESQTYIGNRVILTALDVVIEQDDLLDRALIIKLDRVPDERRRTEEELWKAFKADVPDILGGMLTTLQEALKRYPEIEVKDPLRLADFSRYSCAVAEALGYDQDDFLSAYRNTAVRASEQNLMNDPFARVIMEYIEEHGEISGTPTVVFQTLWDYAGKDGYFPKDVAVFGRKLRTRKKALEDNGISVEDFQTNKGRMLKLSKKPDEKFDINDHLKS